MSIVSSVVTWPQPPRESQHWRRFVPFPFHSFLWAGKLVENKWWQRGQKVKWVRNTKLRCQHRIRNRRMLKFEASPSLPFPYVYPSHVRKQVVSSCKSNPLSELRECYILLSRLKNKEKLPLPKRTRTRSTTGFKRTTTFLFFSFFSHPQATHKNKNKTNCTYGLAYHTIWHMIYRKYYNRSI